MDVKPSTEYIKEFKIENISGNIIASAPQVSKKKKEKKRQLYFLK